MADVRVCARSELKREIKVNIPKSGYLQLKHTILSFTFISDNAFALTTYLMKPYSHIKLFEEESTFIYMLSRSRHVF